MVEAQSLEGAKDFWVLCHLSLSGLIASATLGEPLTWTVSKLCACLLAANAEILGFVPNQNKPTF